MKLSKTLLRVMVISVATGAINACKKLAPDGKKAEKKIEKTNSSNVKPSDCPACGGG